MSHAALSGPLDDAVRRRAAAERDELDVAARRVEPAEMAAALRREPDAAVGRGRDVVDAGALARRQRPAAHAPRCRRARSRGQATATTPAASERGSASRRDRMRHGSLRETRAGASSAGTLYSTRCGTLSSGSFRASRCTTRCASPSPGAAARDQDDDLLHVRLPLRHPRAPARRRAALHRRQPEPPDQQGRDLRQGRVRDHEAGLAGAADAAAAAQARQRARRRRVRADLVGARLRDPRRAAREDPRHRPEEVRALHRARPDAGADRPVRAPVRHARTTRRTAASARSTWPPG